MISVCKEGRLPLPIHPSMELDSDTYDVVVVGTGLAESIAAAHVAFVDEQSRADKADPSQSPASRSSTSTRTNTTEGRKLPSPWTSSRYGPTLDQALHKPIPQHQQPMTKAKRIDTPTPLLPNSTTRSLPIEDDTPYPFFHRCYPPEVRLYPL